MNCIEPYNCRADKDNDIIRMPGSIRYFGIHSIQVSNLHFRGVVFLDGTGEKFEIICAAPYFDIEHFEPSADDIEKNGPENFNPFNIYHLHQVTIAPYFDK